jgi:hypothetical protein
MAGKIRHPLHRDGRYYGRKIVPQELRLIVGRSEVREPLSADKGRAVEQLPFAIGDHRPDADGGPTRGKLMSLHAYRVVAPRL